MKRPNHIYVIQQWLSEIQKVGPVFLSLQATVKKIVTLCISNINIRLENSFIRLPKLLTQLQICRLLKFSLTKVNQNKGSAIE